MSILTMKNIYKSFDQTTALNNVNFEVSKGEIFGFLGPSGAGKTTTVKLFTGQLIQRKVKYKSSVWTYLKTEAKYLMKSAF